MSRRSIRHSSFAALIALAPVAASTLEACSTDAAVTGEGSAEFIATTAQELNAAGVAKVTVTITGPGITSPIVANLVKSGGQWKGTIGGIPVGSDRTFRTDAFDANSVVLYSGVMTGVTIARGAPRLVAVQMQQTTPPDPFRNSAPRIDTLLASSSALAPGDTVGLVATAHDPDPTDTLTYSWTSNTGAFTNPGAPSTSFTAGPTDGTVHLNLRVTDSRGAVAAMAFDLEVRAVNARGTASIATTLNTWPEITLVTASRTRLGLGESTALAVTAGDADADVLHHAWSADCAGTFDEPGSANAVFTLAAPLPASGKCTFTVGTSDTRGGETSGTLTIATGPAAPVVRPPVIDSTFQSSDSASFGEDVVFRLTAHDAEGGPVSIAWSAGTGTIVPTADGARWTAPQCGLVHTITATITGASGTTTKTFDVGSGTFLARDLPGPNQLARAGTKLFVSTTEDNGLRSLSTAGNDVVVRKTGEPITRLVATPEALFWTSYGGGAVKVLTHTNWAFAVVESTPFPFAMAVNDTRVFWSAQSSIRTSLIGTGPTTTIGATAGWGYDFVADANFLFATDFAGRTLRRLPIAGGQPRVLSMGRSGALAIGGGYAFAYDHDANVIVRWDPETSARFTMGGFGVVTALASDATHLYIASPNLGGSLFRATFANPTAEMVACGTGVINDVELDATSVYVSAADARAVVRIAK